MSDWFISCLGCTDYSSSLAFVVQCQTGSSLAFVVVRLQFILCLSYTIRLWFISCFCCTLSAYGSSLVLGVQSDYSSSLAFVGNSQTTVHLAHLLPVLYSQIIIHLLPVLHCSCLTRVHLLSWLYHCQATVQLLPLLYTTRLRSSLVLVVQSDYGFHRLPYFYTDWLIFCLCYTLSDYGSSLAFVVHCHSPPPFCFEMMLPLAVHTSHSLAMPLLHTIYLFAELLILINHV